jgi:hypothetical protein
LPRPCQLANDSLTPWLAPFDEAKWQDCPLGLTAQERKVPWRTRVQEVPSGNEQQRVFVIDSEERRHYEQAKRQQAQERTRQKLERVQRRVAAGELTDPDRCYLA